MIDNSNETQSPLVESPIDSISRTSYYSDDPADKTSYGESHPLSWHRHDASRSRTLSNLSFPPALPKPGSLPARLPRKNPERKPSLPSLTEFKSVNQLSSGFSILLSKNSSGAKSDDQFFSSESETNSLFENNSPRSKLEQIKESNETPSRSKRRKLAQQKARTLDQLFVLNDVKKEIHLPPPLFEVKNTGDDQPGKAHVVTTIDPNRFDR